MTKTFNFYDVAICPECGKPLDEPAIARDFIAVDRDGKPKVGYWETECGWCDAVLEAFCSDINKNEVTIKNKY